MDHPQFEAEKKPYDPALNPEAFSPELPAGGGSHGCFFYGCIIAVVLAVLGLICLGVAAFTLWRLYTGLLNDYTSTMPAPIPQVSMSGDDRKMLDERWAAFRKAVDKNEAAEIVLSADDINALIAESKELKGKVYISIKDDKVTAQVSIPLTETGIPGTSGRYFNGRATIKASLKKGELIVFVEELEANGKTLPPNVRQQLAGQNIAKDFTNQPDNAKMIRKFESVEVKDDKVYIKARAGGEEASEDETTKPSETKPSEKKDDTAKAKPDDSSLDKPKDEPAKEKEKEKAKEPAEPKEPKEPAVPKKAA
jgi:hypothetical protein